MQSSEAQPQQLLDQLKVSVRPKPPEEMVGSEAAPRKKGQWRRQRKWPEHRIAGELTCETCGKVYPAKTYQIRRGQRFCSGACRYPLTDEQRFWKSVDKSEHPMGCWIWTGAKCSSRYGNMLYLGRSMLAHRVAFIIANGSLPDDAVVMHSCDNGFCVNPSHLSAGTQLDNVRDMHAKGRFQTAVLSTDDVVKIRASNLSRIELACAYGVSARTIADIKTGKDSRGL